VPRCHFSLIKPKVALRNGASASSAKTNFQTTASLLALAAAAHPGAQTRSTGEQTSGERTSFERTPFERTPWGDPDLQGEWTPQFGTRQLLTADEYACHEGNYGLSYMLSASRYVERTKGEGR
jgi:hypothetical protein